MDYWSTVDKTILAIEKLVSQFHPFYKNDHKKFKITAQKAEDLSVMAREDIKNDYSVTTPLEQLIYSYKNRNKETFRRIMNETWFGMPESAEVHNIPGFYILCDLCSED